MEEFSRSDRAVIANYLGQNPRNLFFVKTATQGFVVSAFTEEIALAYISNSIKNESFTIERIGIAEASCEKGLVLKASARLSCTCDPEETTGTTQVHCCNHCGYPVEDFWEGMVDIPC
jgi:hypothetical protein